MTWLAELLTTPLPFGWGELFVWLVCALVFGWALWAGLVEHWRNRSPRCDRCGLRRPIGADGVCAPCRERLRGWN